MRPITTVTSPFPFRVLQERSIVIDTIVKVAEGPSRASKEADAERPPNNKEKSDRDIRFSGRVDVGLHIMARARIGHCGVCLIKQT